MRIDRTRSGPSTPRRLHCLLIADFNALLATTMAGLNDRLGGATRILVKELVP